MPETSFLVDCQPGSVRYRVRFVSDKGKVLEFVVQLEYRTAEDWVPVLRIDTAHGFAHCDICDPEGNIRPHQPLGITDYNEALTYALDMVKGHWRDLILPFEGESS
jgi:hypothetical protein